jgi:lauroyl/myristoyl acyltransferase
LPALALRLVRALPASPAVFLFRTIVLVYLAFRPDYRAEIRRNLALVCGRDSRWFWVRNAWQVGQNLALMARLGTGLGNKAIDNAEVCWENTNQKLLEQDLHVIMVSFHFGAWEYLPMLFSALGFRVRLVTGGQQDQGLARSLADLRSGTGVELVSGLEDAERGMQQPGLTGFMLDNTARGRRTWVELDGLRIGMPSLAFRMARSRQVRVVPLFARFEDNRLLVQVYGPTDERGVVLALLDQVRRKPEDWVFWAKAGALEQRGRAVVEAS